MPSNAVRPEKEVGHKPPKLGGINKHSTIIIPSTFRSNRMEGLSPAGDLLKGLQNSPQTYTIHRYDTDQCSPANSMYLPGSRSSAGFPSPADDYIDKQLDLNDLLIQNKAATFFMRVDGDALQTGGIRHGDMLIVDRSINATHGKIVVAVIAGELVVRRAETQNQQLLLTSDDSSHDQHIIDGEDIQIWGVATSVIHQL